MLIKVYIKDEIFYLPQDHNDLTSLIKNKFFKNKTLIKSSIHKIYPISKIEKNENIIINKQNTNIFLLNLLLNVLHLKNLQINEPNFYNNTFIIEQLEELTNLNLNTDLNTIEQKILNYINSLEKKEFIDTSDTRNTNENMKIEFTLNWVKNMYKKLN